MANGSASSPPPFVPEDIDGFLALGLGSLITIALTIELCRGVLGFPAALITGRVLPGMGSRWW